MNIKLITKKVAAELKQDDKNLILDGYTLNEIKKAYQGGIFNTIDNLYICSQDITLSDLDFFKQ